MYAETLKAVGLLSREQRACVRDFMRWQDSGEDPICAEADIAEAIYWFSVDYHDGQWNDLYAAGCAIGEIYSPGRGGHGCEPDSSAESLYRDLARTVSSKVELSEE